ncbi:MDS3 Negative regulator of sporulation MDS3 [Candida maltosa Xu316]
MSTLIPTSSACYGLQLPPTEKDDRLNLNVRTGSASTLYNSLVFTHGGLTIGLELFNHNISEINEIFYNRVNVSNSKFKSFDKYLSGELFSLNLIERTWSRVILETNTYRPKPRMLHQMCAINNCIYLFGGLVLPDNITDETQPSLVPTNDLWEFDLQEMKWTLLHDGSNHELDDAVPTPRYNHKMTLVSSLSFVNRNDHFGIFIAGGKDKNSNPIYDNVVFDLVERRFVGSQPFQLITSSGNPVKDLETGLSSFISNKDHAVNIDHTKSVIINYIEDIESQRNVAGQRKNSSASSEHQESIIVYGQTTHEEPDNLHNPLVSFKLGRKQMKTGKVLRLHKNIQNSKSMIIPYNLSYPTGGLFGQNIVVTGFLPDEYDISIFVYNKPTGKWSRLNIFCNHDYGSHRFWGGFAWQSHHKVVLIGNNLTSRTTSSVRFFSVMLTVSLPITNILVSSELSNTHMHYDKNGTIIYHKNELHQRSQNDVLARCQSSSIDSNLEYSTDSSSERVSEENYREEPVSTPMSERRKSMTSIGSDKSPTAVSFSEYVHYAAPKTTFTNVRSVFPPEAITLGRNAFDRYGDLISDFEMVSCNGDRIPVSSAVLMERWGRFFIQLLAKGYVHAVDKFENDQALGLRDDQRLRSKSSHSDSTSSDTAQLKLSRSESSLTSTTYDHEKKDKVKGTSKQLKDVPQFRLPFQESKQPPQEGSDSSDASKERAVNASISSAIDPHQVVPRKNSVSSFQSSSSSLLTSHLQDIPPQLPLPQEQIPAVPAAPASYKSSSRKNSQDHSSPRSSLIHTLTALRNIPLTRSPRDSPFSSPRPSLSAQSSSGSGGDLFSAPFPNLRPNHGSVSSASIRKKSFDSSAKSSDDKSDSLSSGNSSMARLSSVTYDHRDSDDGSISPPEFPKKREGLFDNALLNFDNINSESFKMEPSLIPRKLYFPFTSVTVKAFCEYLYTGQIGNKWLFAPTLMDNMLISKFFKVPLLYDLISELLFGIIGRKEAYIIEQAQKLKSKYSDLMKSANLPLDKDEIFPLDEYEGFLDTIDDGYLDIALLIKTSKVHADSVALSLQKKSVSSGHSHKSYKKDSQHDEPPKDKKDGEQEQPQEVNEDDDEDNKTSSTSEEDEVDKEYPLVYLDAHESHLPIVGPRSKSVFDRHGLGLIEKAEEEEHQNDKSENTITVEELVAPNSPIPSDFVIDLIFETATLVTDMKLLLRASNLRAMTAKFHKSKANIELAMASIEHQGAQKPAHDSSNSALKSATELMQRTTKEPGTPVPLSIPVSRNSPAPPPRSPVAVSSPLLSTTASTPHSDKEESETLSIPKLTKSSSFQTSPGRRPYSNNNSSQSSLKEQKVQPSNSQLSLNTTKSTSSLSRIASHSSLRAFSAASPFTSSSKKKNNNNERAQTEIPQDKPEKLGKSRSHNLVPRIPSNKKDERVMSSASSIKSNKQKHSFFHLGHKKRENPGVPFDDAFSITSSTFNNNNNQNTGSDSASVNSDSSNRTNATTSLRKKFGLLSGFKK